MSSCVSRHGTWQIETRINIGKHKIMVRTSLFASRRVIPMMSVYRTAGELLGEILKVPAVKRQQSKDLITIAVLMIQDIATVICVVSTLWHGRRSQLQAPIHCSLSFRILSLYSYCKAGQSFTLAWRYRVTKVWPHRWNMNTRKVTRS